MPPFRPISGCARTLGRDQIQYFRSRREETKVGGVPIPDLFPAWVRFNPAVTYSEVLTCTDRRRNQPPLCLYFLSSDMHGRKALSRRARLGAIGSRESRVPGPNRPMGAAARAASEPRRRIRGASSGCEAGDTSASPLLANSPASGMVVWGAWRAPQPPIGETVVAARLQYRYRPSAMQSPQRPILRCQI